MMTWTPPRPSLAPPCITGAPSLSRTASSQHTGPSSPLQTPPPCSYSRSCSTISSSHLSSSCRLSCWTPLTMHSPHSWQAMHSVTSTIAVTPLRSQGKAATSRPSLLFQTLCMMFCFRCPQTCASGPAQQAPQPGRALPSLLLSITWRDWKSPAR